MLDPVVEPGNVHTLMEGLDELQNLLGIISSWQVDVTQSVVSLNLRARLESTRGDLLLKIGQYQTYLFDGTKIEEFTKNEEKNLLGDVRYYNSFCVRMKSVVDRFLPPPCFRNLPLREHPSDAVDIDTFDNEGTDNSETWGGEPEAEAEPEVALIQTTKRCRITHKRPADETLGHCINLD